MHPESTKLVLSGCIWIPDATNLATLLTKILQLFPAQQQLLAAAGTSLTSVSGNDT